MPSGSVQSSTNPSRQKRPRADARALRRACAPVAIAMIEPLEDRQLLSAALGSARHLHHTHHVDHQRHLRQIKVSRSIQATATTALASAAPAPIVRPDHIVIVIEEDRASGAIGDTAHMPYFNQLAASGLVYTNSHGVAHPSLPDYLALYSGSTQGITDNGNNHTFTGPNLAKSLNSTLLPSGQYLSFAGYTESLPRDGDTTTRIAGDPNDPTAPPDLYMRNYNPMAQFTDVGAHGATAITNAQVNKTFASFPTTAAGFANLPTVSFIIPNNLHNTHGSNEQAPYATDPSEYNFLRANADTWLKAKLDGYLQWAKANNSLLIVTTDEEETDSTPTSNLTTIINGDPDLVVPGSNATSFNHFNVLRTIEDMYGLTPLGTTATVSPLTLNALGQLSYPGQITSQADSSTALTSSNSAPVWGQNVTFTATVTAASGVPTGTVTFKDGTTILGSGTLNASGQASLTTSALSVSSHALTAVYNGDASFKTSTSTALNQTVNQASSSVTVSSSAFAGQGQPVSFSATVAISSPGAGTPTGSVQFQIDGVNFGAPVTLNSGTATSPSTSSLSPGQHTFTALYSGDANVTPGSGSSATQIVAQQSTSTSVTSSPSPSVFGQAVTFFAAVSTATGTPTGTVTFMDGTTAIGTASLNASGQATLITGSLAVASHSITATYSGDATFAISTSPALTHQVAQASTATALKSSANPSAYAIPITFTATVTPIAPGSGVPPGTIQFVIDGVNVGAPVTLTNGSATSPAIANLAPGAHTISATYSGSANFAASTSAALTQTVTANAPAAPTNVAASDGAYADRVRITWTAPAGATAYEVWRNTASSSGSAVKINATDITGITYDDTTAVAGTTYYYWVKAKNAGGTSGFSASNTGFRAVGALVNDSFANRTTITGPSVTLTATNKGATKEAGEPNHAGNVGGKSIWYTWSAPASGKVTIDTTGSNFDTLLAVYTGASVSTLTAVPGGANDDSPAGGTTTSKVSFNVTAGTTYQIAIDGYGGVYGNITLHLALV
jgi:hypothetical protein